MFIAGRLLRDHRPLVGASLALEFESGQPTIVSDAAGGFAFGRLCVSGPQLLAISDRSGLVAFRMIGVVHGIAEVRTFEIGAPSTIHGRVVDRRGNALENAQVTTGPLIARTRPNGDFDMLIETGATYELAAESADGYHRGSARVAAMPGTPPPVTIVIE